MVYTITGNTMEVSKDVNTGTVWRGVFVSAIACIPFFTHGVETTTLTSSAHSGHFISSDDVPWSTTAMVLAAAVAAPMYCYVVDKFGRRIGVFVVSLVQGASLIPLFLQGDPNTIILHIFAGLSSGGLFTIIPTYIKEISSMKTQGFTISLMIVMMTAGYMMKLVMSLEEMMYLMVVLVMSQIILMIFVLESPSYLVMKGKFETAKIKEATLKGLAVDSQIVTKEISRVKDESDRAKANGKLYVRTVYRNKVWWDSFKIGLVLHTTMTLCGSIVFLDQQKTLIQLKLDADPQGILVLGGLFTGSLFSVLCITIFDRKYLLTFGYVTMALASGVLAVYTQADLTVTSLRWLPVAALAVLVFSYGVSWGLPVIIMVEMFNIEIRATLIGVIYTYSQMIKLIHVHTFKYIEDSVGIHTMFYVFACINLYGAVYALFVVPNIKNRSLRQIEKQVKRIPLPA